MKREASCSADGAANRCSLYKKRSGGRPPKFKIKLATGLLDGIPTATLMAESTDDEDEACERDGMSFGPKKEGTLSL